MSQLFLVTASLLACLAIALTLICRSAYLTSLVLIAVLLFILAALQKCAGNRKKLRQPISMINRLRKGDLSARCLPAAPDDLSELSGALNGLAAEMERQESFRKQWMMELSHELRTPVALVQAQIESWQDGVQEASPDRLALLHQEVSTMAQIIDNFYDLARYDLNQLRFDFESCDLPVLLIETTASFEDSSKNAESKLPKLSVDYSGIVNLHAHVKADAARLKQVFVNLLENSMRFTDNGGRLLISGGLHEGKLLLAFDDSAPGVPDEFLSRIFERFSRLEPSRSREFGGSGLGMSLCKTIIEAHGGSINAKASPLGGLRVEIELPLMEKDNNG